MQYVQDMVLDSVLYASKDIYFTTIIVYSIAQLLPLRMDRIALPVLQIAHPVLIINRVPYVIIFLFF